MVAAVCTCGHLGPRSRLDAFCNAGGQPGACPSGLRECCEPHEPLPAVVVMESFLCEDFVAYRIHSANPLHHGNFNYILHLLFQDPAIT